MKARWVFLVVCVVGCGGKTPAGGGDVVPVAVPPSDTLDTAADTTPRSDALDVRPLPDVPDTVDTSTPPDTVNTIDADAPCVPGCEGKECGDDGCGGSCGSCDGGFNCQAGVCVDGPCQPDCSGKECGDDGCGGLCGSCGAGKKCKGGDCVVDPCDPCYLWEMEDGLDICTAYQACSTSADCPVHWAYSYECVDGACVWDSLNCTSDAQCVGWCLEVYDIVPDPQATCDALEFKCEASACPGQGKACVLYSACDTTADCPEHWAYTYECIGGACIWEPRLCTSSSQCDEWCLAVYGDLPDPSLACDSWGFKCEVGACPDQGKTCTQYTACTTTADCPVHWAYTYECVAGLCLWEWRDCTSGDQCEDWCLDTYDSMPDPQAACDTWEFKCE